VRGSIQRAKKDKKGLPKNEHTYNLILSLGRGPNGTYRQKWIRFHGTREQAQQKLTELTGEVHKGEFIEPSKITVDAWIDEWMEKSIKPRCAVNTYRAYLHVVKKYLKPGLGHVLLQQLTPLQVGHYYAERGAKLSARTVSVHHVLLTSALSAAVQNGLVRHNVAQRVSNKPRGRPSEDALHNVWTGEEARKFLTQVKKSGDAQYAAFFALALDSGLRKGELLGLLWKDLEGATLRVERQLLGTAESETGGLTLQMSTPKGKRARSLDLSDETLSLLREHKKRQSEVKMANRLHYTDHGLMFAQEWEHQQASGLGAPLSRASVRVKLDRLCTAAGVKRITVHGLRHTCATLLLSAGIPPHVVQRRLGHKDISMTLGIYSHVLPTQQADAAQKLAALLHG
jgi:integrase